MAGSSVDSRLRGNDSGLSNKIQNVAVQVDNDSKLAFNRLRNK